MMWRLPEARYDVASAISQGGREYQEDAVVTDFPVGTDSGFVVLADGMGGHAAGDVASKIVVTEVYSELKFHSEDFLAKRDKLPELFNAAANSANEVVRDHVKDHPETRGMGATLVSLVIIEDKAHWISIGDSPLYHYRAGKMSQLNEDHSMAPQIDFMIKSGLIDEETGKNHPDRNCLTSVILGENVAKIDCPANPIELRAGDILLVSSDGLQYLDEVKIAKIITKNRKRVASDIANQLLAAIKQLDDPNQDNVSFSLIKINHNNSMAKPKSTTRRSGGLFSFGGGSRVVKDPEKIDLLAARDMAR